MDTTSGLKTGLMIAGGAVLVVPVFVVWSLALAIGTALTAASLPFKRTAYRCERLLDGVRQRGAAGL